MKSANIFSSILRWTARGIGGLILAFVLLHLISEGLPRVEQLTLGDGLLWAGFILSLLGFALLWKWQLAGGVVALTGITLFFAMNYVMSGKLPLGWVMLLFFLPGILSIVCWLLDRRPSFR